MSVACIGQISKSNYFHQQDSICVHSFRSHPSVRISWNFDIIDAWWALWGLTDQWFWSSTEHSFLWFFFFFNSSSFRWMVRLLSRMEADLPAGLNDESVTEAKLPPIGNRAHDVQHQKSFLYQLSYTLAHVIDFIRRVKSTTLSSCTPVQSVWCMCRCSCALTCTGVASQAIFRKRKTRQTGSIHARQLMLTLPQQSPLQLRSSKVRGEASNMCQSRQSQPVRSHPMKQVCW